MFQDFTSISNHELNPQSLVILTIVGRSCTFLLVIFAYEILRGESIFSHSLSIKILILGILRVISGFNKTLISHYLGFYLTLNFKREKEEISFL